MRREGERERERERVKGEGEREREGERGGERESEGRGREGITDLRVQKQNTLSSLGLLDVLHDVCDVEATQCWLRAELCRTILIKELVTLCCKTEHSDTLLCKDSALHILNNEHFIHEERYLSVSALPTFQNCHHFWCRRLC